MATFFVSKMSNLNCCQLIKFRSTRQQWQTQKHNTQKNYRTSAVWDIKKIFFIRINSNCKRLARNSFARPFVSISMTFLVFHFDTISCSIEFHFQILFFFSLSFCSITFRFNWVNLKMYEERLLCSGSEQKSHRPSSLSIVLYKSFIYVYFQWV